MQSGSSETTDGTTEEPSATATGESLTDSTPGESDVNADPGISPDDNISSASPSTTPAPSTTLNISVSKVKDVLYKTDSAGKKTFAPDPTNAVSEYDNLTN